MDKEDVVYICNGNGILLGDEKEWNLAISDNVDGTRVCYAKWNKSARERQMYDFTHVEFKKHNRWTEGKGKKNKIKI